MSLLACAISALIIAIIVPIVTVGMMRFFKSYDKIKTEAYLGRYDQICIEFTQEILANTDLPNGDKLSVIDMLVNTAGKDYVPPIN